MQKKANGARVCVGVLVFVGALGLCLLQFGATQGSRTGVVAAAASGQSGTGSTPLLTQPADPIYIKFDGVDGESQDAEHRDWVDLLSFSQGQYLPPSPWTGGGSRTVVIEEFALKKTLDKASPKLAEAVCTGKVFPKVDVHVARPSSGKMQVYYTYELKNVIVSSYHISGSTQEEIPSESISLNFEQIKVTYTKFDAAGRAQGTVEYSWNVDRNLPR